MPTIVPGSREAFLSRVRAAAWALAVAFAALPGPASADELLVGALRDQDGAVVTNARVVAVDARGTPLARDRSAADGTFALSAPGTPVAVLVRADDADPLRIPVAGDGRPLVGIVRRHRAADRVPTPADVAALPAGSLAALAAVIPYRVAGEWISDRALDRDRGVVTIEGLPFYRPGDDTDATTLLPDHAAGALLADGPLAAPWYGDRGGGGLIDAQLFDRSDALRLTTGGVAAAGGSALSGFAAESWDADGARRVAAARGEIAIPGGSASFVALTGVTPDTAYAGFGAELRVAGPRLLTDARFALTRDDATDAAYGPDDGTVASATLDLSGPGPDALLVRARWRDEQAAYGDVTGEHHDAALVLGTSRGETTRVALAVAFEDGDERYDGIAPRSALAILPAIAVDTPLAANWTLHAGLADSTLGTPGDALARGSLGEAGVAYDDKHRLRAEILAYAESEDDPHTLARGIAASLNWEIAPRLSLRAWTLNDLVTPLAGPFAASAPPPGATPYRPGLLWLTWDAGARVDLLVRGGALEGGLRLPLGRRAVLSLGSFRRPTGRRDFDLGLVAR